MRGADVRRRKRVGTGSVPQQVQVSPHVGQPTPGTAGDVLDDDEARRDLLDDPAELVPESASLTGKTGALARRADVLAGEPSAEETDLFDFLPVDSSNILIPLRARPVLSQHLAAEGIALDLPHDLTAEGALETELKPSNAAKKRPDPHV